MNEFLTARIPGSALSGDIAPDLLTANGPQGDQFPLKVPTGWAAKLFDFSIFSTSPSASARFGCNLVKSPVPVDGDVPWTAISEVMRDSNQIAALSNYSLFLASGRIFVQFPHTAHLWDLDYRLVINPRVTGFAQVAQNWSFRLRYKLVRASRAEVAAILFWQNQGVKFA